MNENLGEEKNRKQKYFSFNFSFLFDIGGRRGLSRWGVPPREQTSRSIGGISLGSLKSEIIRPIGRAVSLIVSNRNGYKQILAKLKIILIDKVLSVTLIGSFLGYKFYVSAQR